MRHAILFSTLGLVLVTAVALSDADETRPRPDRSLTNSLGMKFIWVAVEAAPRTDRFAKLTTELGDVPGFYLAACEVTQDDFSRVMQRNPSEFAATGKLKRRVIGLDTRRLPVDSVSWNEAVEFCRRLSAMPAEQSARRSYRLPTETEWEFASRAGSPDHWCFGNDRSKLDQYAWFGFEKCDRRPHAVGQKKPNALGLFDMYGNVWEWCQDPDPPADDAADRFQDQPAPSSRVIRGGGWMSQPNRCNSVYRQTDPPTVGDPDSGFRVLLIQSPPSR